MTMDAVPIPDRPALSIRDMGILVVGDLHIGIESHLSSKGFHIPSQTFRMEDELESIADGHDRLVIIGDVKHQVPGSTFQEHREVPRFFESLLDVFERVDVVRGNHDSGLEPFLPSDVSLHPATGLRIGGVGLVHGHTWPSNEVMSSDLLVMAHSHPAVQFLDGVGKRTTEPCWLRGTFASMGRYLSVPGSVIVVPAMNRALGGSPVNLEGRELLGPLFRQGLLDRMSMDVYLLDGVRLGRVSEMLISGRSRGSSRSR